MYPTYGQKVYCLTVSCAFLVPRYEIFVQAHLLILFVPSVNKVVISSGSKMVIRNCSESLVGIIAEKIVISCIRNSWCTCYREQKKTQLSRILVKFSKITFSITCFTSSKITFSKIMFSISTKFRKCLKLEKVSKIKVSQLEKQKKGLDHIPNTKLNRWPQFYHKHHQSMFKPKRKGQMKKEQIYILNNHIQSQKQLTLILSYSYHNQTHR